jgi:hypothetical protein
MEDWLKRRLSPVKDETDRWTELSSSLQTYWEENFDPYHTDLLNLRSVYTMSRTDLAMKMRELGDYFLPDWPTEYDQSLSVAWREGEILRKSTEYILTSTFRRNFRNLTVSWVQLYAPKTGDYGTVFIAENGVLGGGGSLTDYFLTSRGKISLDMGDMYKTSWTKDTFVPVAEKLVKKIKPLHIVYDGIFFEWNLRCDATNITSNLSKQVENNISININFSRRYDIIRADEAITDDGGNNADVKIFNALNISMDFKTKLVGPLLDEIQLDAMELDF